EELEALRATLAQAAGIDAERGDKIEVHSIPFASTMPDATAAPEAGAPAAFKLPHVKPLHAAIAGGVLVLVLAVSVVRSLRRRRRAAPMLMPSLPMSAGQLEQAIGEGAGQVGARAARPSRGSPAASASRCCRAGPASTCAS